MLSHFRLIGNLNQTEPLSGLYKPLSGQSYTFDLRNDTLIFRRKKDKALDRIIIRLEWREITCYEPRMRMLAMSHSLFDCISPELGLIFRRQFPRHAKDYALEDCERRWIRHHAQCYVSSL